ncbi:hypothetical protein GR160_11070 [Flavobacterium sp. Sd200]|uniref:hypothetical protein n=1 Tax=Flavobacterium sp. Sd200 TaxID=2692211 RepID=UPI00136B99FD|nr:hypothetical protein [Flavobacterium sp. Sd200]MXN91766.1 hypothetical protein [Flavobacterium sp. Sd200]
MKKIALLLFFMGCILTHAQEIGMPVKFLSNTKTKPQRYIGTDAFGWEYTIADNEFRKTGEGKTLKYKNVALGEIYRADLQNPLQIVLFYRRFNTVVLLDNQLNETAVINFSALPVKLIAEAVGLASQNRLWLYDVTTQQIGLYDPLRNNFRALTPPFNDGMKYYQSDYNYFYWIDNTGKCFELNLFGKVRSLGSVPDFDAAQLLSPTLILYSLDNSLYLYDLSSQTAKHIDITEKSFVSFYYASQILSIFTESEIIKYNINLN